MDFQTSYHESHLIVTKGTIVQEGITDQWDTYMVNIPALTVWVLSPLLHVRRTEMMKWFSQIILKFLHVCFCTHKHTYTHHKDK